MLIRVDCFAPFFQLFNGHSIVLERIIVFTFRKPPLLLFVYINGNPVMLPERMPEC